MTRSKRKPIQNEDLRKVTILAYGGETTALTKAWDNIIQRDRENVGKIYGPVPRFVRREQGKWRKQRRAEDRKLRRELTQAWRAQ